MLGTISGLWILVKNHHLSQEGTNGLYLNARFEVLTIYSYGDINQNMVKISIIMLGTESCMKV